MNSRCFDYFFLNQVNEQIGNTLTFLFLIYKQPHQSRIRTTIITLLLILLLVFVYSRLASLHESLYFGALGLLQFLLDDLTKLLTRKTMIK